MCENVSAVPKVRDLLVYVTEYCNLKCKHCYYNPTYAADSCQCHKKEVSSSLICEAIDDLIPLGLSSCKFSGGEPFLRPDLLDICRHADKQGLRVLIETNGTLITAQTAQSLSALSGKPFVSISIDGARADTHDSVRGVKGAFEAAVNGIKALTQHDIATQLIVSLFEQNQTEIPELIGMAKQWNCGSVKLNMISSIGRAKSIATLDTKTVIALDASFAEVAKTVGIQYAGPVPPALLDISRILENRIMRCRCNIASTVALLSDGTITTCGMGRYAREFRYGQLGEDRISDVWRNSKSLDYIRKQIPHALEGVCGRCILRNSCVGQCRLNSESMCLEDICKPYAFCAEAESEGHFPESRLVTREQSSAELV